MNHRVTSEQIASYRENGFLIIEDFLNESELETWRSAVDEAVSLRDRNRLPQGS
ncbi:MAG: phytanoyl-CoA dioxygenase family protein, partial [Gemmatimonadetes bacterium]|nr:phytanoyl-CoA dioxygenase family protein [Gemmatimonadota bacterium]